MLRVILVTDANKFNRMLFNFMVPIRITTHYQSPTSEFKAESIFMELRVAIINISLPAWCSARCSYRRSVDTLLHSCLKAKPFRVGIKLVELC